MPERERGEIMNVNRVNRPAPRAGSKHASLAATLRSHNTQLKVYHALLSRPAPGMKTSAPAVTSTSAASAARSLTTSAPSASKSLSAASPDPARQGQRAPGRLTRTPTPPAGQMSRLRRRHCSRSRLLTAAARTEGSGSFPAISPSWMRAVSVPSRESA